MSIDRDKIAYNRINELVMEIGETLNALNTGGMIKESVHNHLECIKLEIAMELINLDECNQD